MSDNSEVKLAFEIMEQVKKNDASLIAVHQITFYRIIYSNFPPILVHEYYSPSMHEHVKLDGNSSRLF